MVDKTNGLGAKSGSTKALLKALLAEAIGTGLIAPWICKNPGSWVVWLEMKITSHLFSATLRNGKRTPG